MNELTQDQIEMLIEAVRAKVEFWRTNGQVFEYVQRAEYARWYHLLTKLQKIGGY